MKGIGHGVLTLLEESLKQLLCAFGEHGLHSERLPFLGEGCLEVAPKHHPARGYRLC